MGGIRAQVAGWAVAAIAAGMGGLLAAAEPAAPAQGPGTEPTVKTVADWWFTLTDTKSNKRMGGQHVIIQQEGKTALIVQDKLAVAQKNTSVGYSATVRYTLQPALAPVSGEVTTNIGGKPYLKGRFTLEGRQLTTTSSLTDADGAVIQAEHTTKVDLPEKGLVLLPQGLKAIAPALLPAQGQVDDIAFLEFPAELDTLVTVDSGFSLVRTDRTDGSALFQLRQGSSADPVWQYVVDKDRTIREGTFYETRFVPSTQQEATRPVTGT